ncbi:DedA family protein [Bacillus sp. SB49]|uniref:DedA family protein n=1 Tax=Bacillus sp. SB49 TaxID=1071080 RepID=UPI0003F69895|nr:DedA family protein [Bacillus sp. SB49]QHT46155.1 DedA family protein [Bacillus sp. SB49]
MENWLLDMMNNYGYIGILLLIALENVFPPIPSEVILTFGGFLTTSTYMSVAGVVAASTAGSVIGALVLYGIGLQLDVERMEKLIDRYGRVLRLTKEDVWKADRWFDKYGPWTVFFCRFVPLVRSLISIPAGMSNMPLGIFLLLTTLGTLIWNVVLVNVGASVGESWTEVVRYMDVYSTIIYILLGIAFLLFVLLYLKKKRRKK